MSSETNEDTMNITIRGVDLEVYNEFTTRLKNFNMSIGDAFNKMIGDVLVDFDEVFTNSSLVNFQEYKRKLPKLSISSHDELTISADDILATKSSIDFNNIGVLSFDSSVTKDIFLRYVRYISRCPLVQFPKDFPKLIGLAHCSKCDNIEFSI